MKVSELQAQLEDFKRYFGDKEVEFWVRTSENEDDDSEEFELHEVHDGYNQGSMGTETVCEIRLGN